MKSDNYILIQGWMISELGLKGNDLLVYAIIYGFSQDGENKFTGSLNYLAKCCQSTKQGVSKNLKKLCELGYIVKNDMVINGVKFCEYHATKFNGVCNKVVRGMQQSLMGGMQLSCTNNTSIDNARDNTRDIREGEDAPPAPPKEQKKSKDIFSDRNFSEPIQAKLEEWFAYKKERRESYKPTGLKTLLTKVENTLKQHSEQDFIAVVDLTMANNWQGIVWDRLGGGNYATNRGGTQAATATTRDTKQNKPTLGTVY